MPPGLSPEWQFRRRRKRRRLYLAAPLMPDPECCMKGDGFRLTLALHQAVWGSISRKHQPSSQLRYCWRGLMNVVEQIE
eukprot:scaffold176641_cov18-Prasinocladus_malaysianus.AAC.1